MAAQMLVPESKHTLFMRGFSDRQDIDEIREFFTKEAGHTDVTIEFFKETDMKGHLYVALRFETKDIAKQILNRFDDDVVLGDRITISYFKDLRRARMRADQSRRSFNNKRYSPLRNGYRPGVYRGTSSNSWNDRDREWKSDRRRSSGGSRSRRHDRSSSRSRSRSGSRSRSPSRSRSRSRASSRSHDRSRSRSRTPQHRDDQKNNKSERENKSRERSLESHSSVEQTKSKTSHERTEERSAPKEKDIKQDTPVRKEPVKQVVERQQWENEEPPRREKVQESHRTEDTPRGSEKYQTLQSTISKPEKNIPVSEASGSERDNQEKNSEHDSWDQIEEINTRGRYKSEANYATQSKVHEEVRYPIRPKPRELYEEEYQEYGSQERVREYQNQRPKLVKREPRMVKHPKRESQSYEEYDQEYDPIYGSPPPPKQKTIDRVDYEEREYEEWQSRRIPKPPPRNMEAGREYVHKRYVQSSPNDADYRLQQYPSDRSEEGGPVQRRLPPRRKPEPPSRSPPPEYEPQKKRIVKSRPVEYVQEMDEYEIPRNDVPRKRRYDNDGMASPMSPREPKYVEEPVKPKYKEEHGSLQPLSRPTAKRSKVYQHRGDGDSFGGSFTKEIERGTLGLPGNKMVLIRQKKDEIEKAYRQDCETFACVVKMLISKDPDLETKLQDTLRRNLKEIGQRCIHELKEFIDGIKAEEDMM